MRLMSSVAALTLLASATAAAAQDLPRRGSLGVGLGNTPTGLTVNSTISDEATEVFQTGDVLKAVNGVVTSDWISLQAAIHQLPSGAPVEVTVERAGAEQTFSVVTVPTPEAKIDGATLEYGMARTADGMRIRTVTMVPESSALANDAGRPAVYYIQGITCQSIDLIGAPEHPRGSLYRGLLEAGFIVGLADKPGTGDSDGEVCTRGGYNAEIEAYQAAAKALAERPDVDPDRVFAIGVSMGGYQAPHIAKAVDFAGIITWGSGVQPWADYIITNFWMRSMINAAQPIEPSEASMADLRQMMARALILEQSPEQIAQDAPELYQRFTSTYGAVDGFAGRSLKFHREIDKTSNAQAWIDYDGALLGLHGSYDWVATEADHRIAGALVTRDGEGSAEFEVVPGVDHGWTYHETLADSFASAFAGKPDRQFHARAIEWLSEKALP